MKEVTQPPKDVGVKMSERTCAICHKGGGTPVTVALRALGIAGNYAHPKCLRRARAKARQS